jgi:dienelactone hydrolase
VILDDSLVRKALTCGPRRGPSAGKSRGPALQRGTRGAWQAAALLTVTLACLALPCRADPLPVDVTSLDRRDGTPLALPGHWFAAARPGRSPAFVLLHGCGGFRDRRGAIAARYTDLAARLNAAGVHALLLDSLTPRGESELCTQRIGQRQVTQTQRRRDALGALQWLAARGDVDAQRLGLLGWSNGGSTVLAATNRRHREVADAPVQAQLAVAFYPGCQADLERGYETRAALLLLVGEADDWTPAAPCRALAQAAQGLRPQIEVFAGAYHGFDGTAQVRLRRDVPNGVNPGHGVHVGGDPAARAAAGQRLAGFLPEQWGVRLAAVNR